MWNPLTHYTGWWYLWIALFFVFEIPALIWHRGKGYTLSEHVWSWFNITGPRSKLWRIRRVCLIAFLGWLTLHFLTGGQF